MKTLLIYTGVYGFTKECVEELTPLILGEVTAVNAACDTIPSLDGFDKVILGSSVYIGQIGKKLKEYCTANADALAKKPLGIFLCCGLSDKMEEVLKMGFPEILLEKAVCKQSFGGELRVEKMKFLHKMMTGMMKKATAKQGIPEPKKLPENITEFANAMNLA